MDLRTYFFLLEAEHFDENTPDEWFEPRSDSTLFRSENQIETFVTGCNYILNTLNDEMDEETIQYHFYEAAKKAFGEEKSSIREFFKMLYLVVFDRPQGSRWGQYVMMVGASRFKDRLRWKLANPWSVDSV